MEAALNDFLEFLNNGWGKKATRYLKPGATFKVMVDENPYSLSKDDGKMELNPGSPERYDILLEISSSAIEYFCKAETEEEAHERLREIMHLGPTPEKYFRMTVENDRSPERGRRRSNGHQGHDSNR